MAYTINGEAVELPAAEDIGGVTFVPAGKVTELLGGYATWNNTDKMAELELNGKKVNVQADNDDVTTGTETYTLPSRPSMGGGSLWVPLALFSDVFGCKVSDDGVGGVSISV